MTWTENLWLYFTLLFGIIIVPGMDMLFVLASSLTGGRRAGLSATAGIMAGGSVHSFYGAVGAGVLASLMPKIFLPMLVAGAAYMVWVGISLIRSSITVSADAMAGSASAWRAFRRGAVSCLTNPKAYLFMLAVYPQFISPAFGPIWLQGLVMGLMTALTQLAVYGALALSAGRSRDFLLASPRATAIVGRTAGVLLVVVSLLSLWRGLAAN